MRVLLVLAVTAAAFAAEDPLKPFRYKGFSYITFNGGACQHGYANLGVTAGGEGFLWRGLTLGGDAGYRNFPAERGAGFGVFSLKVGYHFVDRDLPRKIDPFVAGDLLGIALAPGGHGGYGGLGGGVNYWFRPKLGLRTEFRVNAVARSEALMMFGIGVTFR